MISKNRLINYASNFLESEIEQITELLKNNISDMDRELLSNLKRDYENDLKELEK